MNAQAKGTRNEHRAMRLLGQMGYRCTRSSASLGEWDVIAIGPRDVVLVQVKTNRTAPPAEREAMLRFPAPPCCRKELWIFKDGKRQPIIRSMD